MRRFPSSVLLVIAAALVLASCGADHAPPPSSPPPSVPATFPTPVPTPTVSLLANAQRAQHGGVLVLANRGDPPAAFDTMRTSSIALHHVGGALFGAGNLVKRCRENMYIACPDLASSWLANPGFTEWTFTLRPGVLWHDGTPFTSQDVKFWLETAYFGITVGEKSRAPAYFRGDIGPLLRVDALPDGRARVVLSEPNPFFVDVLTNPRYKIAHPAHLMQPKIGGGDVGIAPLDVGLVGTGPFKLYRYDKGSHIEVRRFDRYWERDARGRPLPYLDAIDYVIMEDAAAMDAAFRTGRLDGGARGEGHYLTTERRQGYEKSLGQKVFFAEMQGGLFRIGFNLLKPGPWQDVRVRRAMSLYIDKEAAIPSVMGGYGYLSPILGPSNPFTNHAFVNWPRFNRQGLEQSRAEAARLMAAAGYAAGFSMNYLCRADLTPRCEFLQAQLAGLGIALKLHVVDEAAWNRGRVSLDYDSQPGPNSTSPVPEGTEPAFGRYSQNPDAYAKHEDMLVDDFYRRLRLARDPRLRISIWRELETYIIQEQVHVIPIAGSMQILAYRSRVKGLIIPPEDGHTHTDFATVWLDK